MGRILIKSMPMDQARVIRERIYNMLLEGLTDDEIDEFHEFYNNLFPKYFAKGITTDQNVGKTKARSVQLSSLRKKKEKKKKKITTDQGKFRVMTAVANDQGKLLTPYLSNERSSFRDANLKN